MCFQQIKKRIQLHQKRKEWRKQNPHNGTSLMNDFNPDCVTVGRMTYGGLNVCNFNTNAHLTIGNFCSIASDVMFVLNADHRMDTISTFPFKARYFGEAEGITKGDIVIGDDVWLGFRSTILSGVHIGQGAVVAAGAMVTKDVPPYAIVAGVPAKVIRYRFEQEMIEELMKIDYASLTDEEIKNHLDQLYSELTDKKQIGWMVKKNK